MGILRDGKLVDRSAAYAYIQPVGYRGAYPTLADRVNFARSFAASDVLRLFYGYPYDPTPVAG